MNTRKQQQGFTIIEVVLVLAIAALIFLMVFIALPALQRNQRDTARKNDASAVAAALNNYRSQNRGTFAGTTPINSAKTLVCPSRETGAVKSEGMREYSVIPGATLCNKLRSSGSR